MNTFIYWGYLLLKRIFRHIWVKIKIIVYYLIRYPIIGLAEIRNWIAINHPYDGVSYPFRGWDKLFWVLDKIIKPAVKFEYWLNYNGYIHTVEF